MNIQQVLENLNNHISRNATVKTVYADPIAVGGRTVIPAAQVRYAFGAGGGSKRDEGTGSGGGGGKVTATPSGALEITAEGTRFIEFGDQRKLGLAIALGFALGAAATALIGKKRIEIRRP